MQYTNVGQHICLQTSAVSEFHFATFVRVPLLRVAGMLQQALEGTDNKYAAGTPASSSWVPLLQEVQTQASRA